MQSMYDLALISWSNAMDPPLPLVSANVTYPAPLTAEHFVFGHQHPLVQTKGSLDEAGSKARQVLADHHAATEQAGEEDSDRQFSSQNTLGQEKQEIWDASDADEADRVDGQFGSEDAIAKHLSKWHVSLYRQVP